MAHSWKRNGFDDKNRNKSCVHLICTLAHSVPKAGAWLTGSVAIAVVAAVWGGLTTIVTTDLYKYNSFACTASKRIIKTILPASITAGGREWQRGKLLPNAMDICVDVNIWIFWRDARVQCWPKHHSSTFCLCVLIETINHNWFRILLPGSSSVLGRVNNQNVHISTNHSFSLGQLDATLYNAF